MQCKCHIKLCKGHKHLWVKNDSHQKAESLKSTSLLKLDNGINNSSIFNAKCAEFFRKGWELLNFYSANLHQKSICPLQPIFTLLFPVLVHRNILTIPLNTPFLYATAFFLPQSTPIDTSIYTKRIFPTSAI